MSYQVIVQWYRSQQGGRQHVPTQGRYFATTSLIEQGIPSTWSIYLDLDQQHADEATLGFLFDTYPKIVQVGDVLPILEGNKKIAILLVMAIRPED